MAVKKITKRWLFNNLGVILVILLALEVAFAIGVRGFFYSSVEQSVNSQANYITSMLKSYSEDKLGDLLHRGAPDGGTDLGRRIRWS